MQEADLFTNFFRKYDTNDKEIEKFYQFWDKLKDSMLDVINI